MNTIINLEELCFHYSNRAVLTNINLNIYKNTTNIILGANGVGKSTLLRLIAGFLHPDTGNILFEQEDMKKLDKGYLSRKIAYVSQESTFSFPFSVLEIVLLGRSPYSGLFEFESKADYIIAENALELVGISHLRDRIIHEVSGGEKQLVSIGRAIAQDPQVMILDEPGTFLDLKHKSQIYNSLDRIKNEKGISIIIATHDINSVRNEFDNFILLKNGEIYKQGKVTDVINEFNLSEIYGTPVKLIKHENNFFVAADHLNN